MATIEFTVPTLGERGDIPDNEMPIQALRLCQNMIRDPREGTLDIRPGYIKLVATGPGGRTMGVQSFKKADGTEIVVAANKTGWSQLLGSVWTDISGTALTGDDTDVVRFQVFSTSGVYNLIGVNGVNTNKIWDGSAATYSDMSGSPPVAIDVSSAANRVLLLIAPDTVRISEFNDPATWPSTGGFNVRLVDVGDHMIGMERMNRTSVGILGDRSQWIARAQSGRSPFRFEKVSEQPGPISRASIVNVGGTLYYLAVDGIIYGFDGTPAVELSRALQQYVNDNIGYLNRGSAHAFFAHQLGKIFFLFPTSSSANPTLGVYYDPRTREMGRLVFTDGLTASAQWSPIVSGLAWTDLTSFTWANVANTYSSWAALGGSTFIRELVGDSAGQVHSYNQGDGSDNGTAISAVWEIPLRTYGGWAMSFVPSAAETFFKKTSSSTVVTPAMGYTDTLMSEPTLETLETFDIQNDRRTDIDLTDVGEKRSVHLRHSVTTATGGVKWQGMLLHGEATDVAVGPTNDV